MKKKQIAVLLAALLSVSPAVEGVAVMGADFSSGEEAVEAMQEQVETEDSLAENVAIETEEAENAGITEGDTDSTGAEDIWTSGEEENEFGTGEIPEVDAFSTEEDDVTDAATAEQGKGSFGVAYITEEQYIGAFQNEQDPGVELKTVEDTTFSEALSSGEGENTGYCYVQVQDLDNPADFAVPEGLTVLVEGARIRSITPKGNITFLGVRDQDVSVEIKEGSGTVTFCHLETDAVIRGTGSNDTVMFYDNAFLGGISGVENIHFGKECRNLNIRGESEFYNLYNDTERPQEDLPVWFQIEGYSAKKAPVFHKEFDWGSGEFDDGNGGHRTAEYGIGIEYIESFDVDGEWKVLDIGANKAGAKFDISDMDALEMIGRVGVSIPENWYLLDLDGKTWMPSQNTAVEIHQFQACGGMTAQETFETYGKGETPENACVGLAIVPSIAQAERYMSAYQKKNSDTEGYYLMHIGSGSEGSETITVPDGVKALKVEGQNNYDESANTDHFVPVNISSANVPAGKKISLCRILVKSNTLTFTGAGTAEIVDSRLDTNVKADKLEIIDAAVKSLECKELVAALGGRLIISEYLKFDKAFLEPEGMVIYGQPGAYLNMGEIKVTESDSNDLVQIFIGENGKKRAQIYFGGNIDSGKVTYEGKEYSRRIQLRKFDEKAARSAGALCAKDCFDESYRYDWYDDETDNWWNYQCQYNNEEICIATIGSTVDTEKIKEELLVILSLKDDKGEQRYCQVAPRCLYLDDYKNLTDGIDGNKRLAFYLDWWSSENEEKPVEIPAYFEFTGETLDSIASAQISDIKTQLYAGKAITPSVTVTLNGKKLKKGTDYTVSYANNTKAGSTASVIITGKGKYVGTATKDFEIAAIPAKGKVYTTGNLKYKVIKSAYKNGTVSVYAPVKKTLTSVSIPATVKINGYTFQVTAIGNKAFAGCTKLKSVKIGAKVTTIGKEAFSGCKALTSITISSNVLKAVGSSAFKGISAKAVIKVPAAKLSAYRKLLKGKGQKSSVKITK